MKKPFYLDGRWIESAETEGVSNPWDGRQLADICIADEQQVEQAIASAHAAFEKTRSQPAWERSKILTASRTSSGRSATSLRASSWRKQASR